MIRRLAPAALVAALALTACLGGAETIDDPNEILTRAVAATADVDTIHFVATLDGTVSFPMMSESGSMSLNGTEMEGRMAMDGSAAELSFAVPAFLGLAGEARLIGDDAFVKTTMTGPMWVRQPVDPASSDPLAQVGDPQEALEQVEAFLDEEGVTVEKLEDVDCGEATCYHLRLTISAEVYADSEAELGLDPSMMEAFGEGVSCDLHIDQQTLLLARAESSFESEEFGSVTFTLTLDEYGDPVEVEAPPDDEVTEDGGFPTP